MRVLIIGGTHFMGRHLVSQLLERDADVTLLNRGRIYWEVSRNFPKNVV